MRKPLDGSLESSDNYASAKRAPRTRARDRNFGVVAGRRASRRENPCLRSDVFSQSASRSAG